MKLTVSIFNPAFAQISLKNATFKLRDGTSPTPKELEVKVGDGNITYNEQRTIEYILDRGNLDEVREGDDVPMDVSFDFNWEYIKGPSSSSTVTTGTPTIEDVLKKIGPASSWTSSDADTCRPYAVDLVILYEPECTGDKEEIVLPDFRWESLNHDVSAGSVSCSGKCNAKVATATRSAQA